MTEARSLPAAGQPLHQRAGTTLPAGVDLITAKRTSSSFHLDAEAGLSIQGPQREIRRKKAVDLVTIRSPMSRPPPVTSPPASPPQSGGLSTDGMS